MEIDGGTPGGGGGVSGGIPGSSYNIILGEPRRTCTYKDFMNYKPMNFYRNEGVVGLTKWIEKIEPVFEICYCSEGSKVRFTACTLMHGALTLWKDHVKTLGVSVANSMSWENMKALLIEEYCHHEEVQNLENELWNLKMKESDVKAYTMALGRSGNNSFLWVQ